MKKQIVSMGQSFRRTITIIGIIILLWFALTTTFSVLAVTLDNPVLLILSLSFFVIGGVTFTIIAISAYKRFKKIYYDNLYRVTLANYTNLGQSNFTYTPYDRSLGIKEINELTDKADSIYSFISNSTFVPKTADFSNIDFEYVDKDRRIIKLESFKSLIQSVILVSQSYRNALLELYFDTKIFGQDYDREYVLDQIISHFKDYPNALFIVDDTGASTYLYLPNIDSISQIKERLFLLIKSSTIASRGGTGFVPLPLHASLVCYPYSNVDELFSDLHYAKRQGMLINVYLPNRLKQLDENTVINTSMNLNYMTRILRNLDNMNFNSANPDHDMRVVRNTLSLLVSYLHIGRAGVIVHDPARKEFISLMSFGNGEKPLFKEGDVVEESFIDALKSVHDDDYSYYFSRRETVNIELAALVDRLNISSGLYQIITYNHDVIAIVYYFNSQKSLHLDSYIRETLYALHQRLSNIFISFRKDQEVISANARFEAVAKIGEFFSYEVDKDYKIKHFTSDLRLIFRNLEEGEYCYKALYGLDKMCFNCPIRTRLKMISEVKNNKYITSLTLNSFNSDSTHLLVRRMPNSFYDTNVFDHNFLTPSFYSFVQYMKSMYDVSARGYILLLTIDNITQLIEKMGSEGSLFVIRSIIQTMKTRLNVLHVFAYNSSTLALVFPEYGHVDILKKCEQIYELSKKVSSQDGNTETLNLTYLPIGFPHGFANAEDLIRNIIRLFNTETYQANKDYIYFLETGYSRSASRHYFMSEVIDKTFTEKNYSFNYQPYVEGKNKRIYGAELLLRIPDAFQGTVLAADELSNVAMKENKVNLITDALLDTVGQLYREYGQNVFKVNDLKRLSINTDVPFLVKDDFINQITYLQKEYKLRKNFIGLEIGEKEVFDNINIIKAAAKKANQHDIDLIVDRYTGKYLSLEQVKDLGFGEIKIDRRLVMNIDKDARQLKQLELLMKAARTNNIKCTVVGVENSDQFTLVKEIDTDVFMQGYHFYKALDKTNLISALQISNKNV